ncbi:MAG: hypothetical protein ACI8TE_001224 [Francisella sp.]|jgi:hypothetical protein
MIYLFMKKVDFNDTLNTTGIDDVKVQIDVALDLIDKNKDLNPTMST